MINYYGVVERKYNGVGNSPESEYLVLDIPFDNLPQARRVSDKVREAVETETAPLLARIAVLSSALNQIQYTVNHVHCMQIAEKALKKAGGNE